jgi:hypothetical protein
MFATASKAFKGHLLSFDTKLLIRTSLCINEEGKIMSEATHEGDDIFGK